MGNYVNGVYVPALLETGWDGEVNDLLASLGRSYIDPTLAPYGADPTGVADSTGAIQAAVDTGRPVVLPFGTFRLGDGNSIVTHADQTIRGVGRGATVISCKNAYAFAAPTSGAQNRVQISDLTVSVRSGATSGGGIKAKSDSYHSQWTIERVDVSNVATNTNPGLWVDGFIGSVIQNCAVELGGGHQLFVDSSGFISNAYTIRDVRVTSTNNSATYAGMHLTGSMARVRDSIIESLRGYGVFLDQMNYASLDGLWFEDNSNHDLYITDAYGVKVSASKFHQNHGNIGTADHINITRSASGGRDHHTITGNSFQDNAASGVNVRIGTNVEFTHIENNRRANYANGLIVDSGSYTTSNDGDAIGNTVGDGVRVNNNFVDFAELSSIGFAGTNHARLWVQDNGAGKTVLQVTFASGATKVIATQD